MYFYDCLNEIKHFLAYNFQEFREKMKYKKTIILLALVVFLLSIAGVSASEIDNTIASENANTIELSTDNDIEDNLQTSEENEALASPDYDEAIAQTDTEGTILTIRVKPLLSVRPIKSLMVTVQSLT